MILARTNKGQTWYVHHIFKRLAVSLLNWKTILLNWGVCSSAQAQRVILANNRHARAMVCSPHLQKIDRFAAELENHLAELGGLLFTLATKGDPGQ